ncbi:MAG: carboxypeptidase regulatory-like domain-containing protein, partial [Burkholderiales bacterium]
MITGTILGKVTDPSGAVVPGAKITAVNVNTGLTRSVLSGDSGDYVITLLPVGEYRVRVEKEGFRSQEHARLQLTIDSKVRVDYPLAIGDLAQEVQVTGEPPLINTESSAMGQVIGNRAVQELPLNGRQFVQLALLTPAVAPEVKGTLSSPLALSGFSFSANGTRYDSNMFLLDGVSIRDSIYARLAVSPSVDAIQEFKVHTSNYSAEFGGQGGAQVNISTKSGTNSFHGSVYEFLRNDVFDARNFFDTQGEKPPFRLNQFGASLGGPIVKDKTFFFANYEGQRIFKGVTIGAAVPTQAMRDGNFSGIAPIFDPVNGVPFVNDQIPMNRIAPYALALLEKIPLPTTAGLGRNFVGFGNRDVDLNQFTA